MQNASFFACVIYRAELLNIFDVNTLLKATKNDTKLEKSSHNTFLRVAKFKYIY